MTNFNFNFKDTAIYRALRLEKHFYFRFANIFQKAFLALAILTFLIFIDRFLVAAPDFETLSRILGCFIIFLVFGTFFQLLKSFFHSRFKNPEIAFTIAQAIQNPAGFNLAELLDFETAQAINQTLKFARSKKITEISSSLLFYFILSDNPKLDFIFSRALISIKNLKKFLKDFVATLRKAPEEEIFRVFSYTEDFRNVILDSLKISQKMSRDRVGLLGMIVAMSQHDPIFRKVLIEVKLKPEDIENLAWWFKNIEDRITQQKKWWDYHNLMWRGTLAKEWAAGYTITLDEYSLDWTEKVRQGRFLETTGHESEIEQVQRVLARQETKNVLIVGEPGTGRKSIIQEFAKKSLLGQALFPQLNYKRVVELDLPSLLARLESVEEVEAALEQIFQEVIKAGNVILFIDEFHNFVGGKERPGVIDISGILAPYLRIPQFQLMAITTYVGLHKYIEQNPSILNLFEKVEVAPISAKDTMRLLQDLSLRLEREHRLLISYAALKNVVTLCERYLPNLPFPEKAVNFLDEIVVHVKGSTKEKIVLADHAAQLMYQKIQIPVGEIEVKEKEILLNMEQLLHRRIINQNEAVNEVAAALRRSRAEVTARKKPMGTFLFLGPTGVGKTETAKAVTEIYFGSESKILRFDMSEFQTVNDIPRLIGGVTDSGFLTTQVRESPFSLVLLDELEKSHPDILNLFLQVLDEGFLTDGFGRKVDFKNTIIIATSNAGYKVILQAIGEKTPWSQVKDKLLEDLFDKGTFRPEFINRFDAVVVFKPLSKENLLDIAELMLQKIRENLQKRDIDFVITLALKEKMVELGYDPTFGARNMKRVIQDTIENVLASAILKDEIKGGDRIELDPKDFKLKVTR